MKSESSIPRPRLGWPLLPLPDKHGRLNYPTLEPSVRESIEAILRTRPGERLMRPEFGGGLADFLHQPNILITRRRIRDRIQDSLERWEKRIQIHRIDVAEDAENPSRVRVEIVYRLRRTGAVQQLGINLDLNQSNSQESS